MRSTAMRAKLRTANRQEGGLETTRGVIGNWGWMGVYERTGDVSRFCVIVM